jgi:hypothetical protein
MSNLSRVQVDPFLEEEQARDLGMGIALIVCYTFVFLSVCFICFSVGWGTLAGTALMVAMVEM